MEYATRDHVVRYQFPLGDELHVVFALVIPDKLPPSFNDLIGSKHVWRNQQRRWFQHFISRQCQAMPPAIRTRRSCRIDLFKKGHLDDASNLDARSKMLLDSLKQLGMITDDDNEWLDWGRVYQRNHSRIATVILLSETLDAEMLGHLDELSLNALEIVTHGSAITNM